MPMLPSGPRPDTSLPPPAEDEVQARTRDDPDYQPGVVRDWRPIPFVRTLRRKLRLSLTDFASRYGIPATLVEDWERHRTEPDGAALAYLELIATDPDAVARIRQAAE